MKVEGRNSVYELIKSGKEIEKVSSIRLTAFIEGSAPAVINIENGT